MFYADYHTHCNFSSDSDAPMEEMIKSAINKGLKSLALTDHVDYLPHYKETDYSEYMIVFNELKEKYAKKIELVFGVEIGLESKNASKINDFTKKFPFDFIIGSSHSVCMLDLYFDDYFRNMNKKEAYELYFTEMLKNINTINDFCVYGHIDFISRYGKYSDNSLSYDDYKEIIDCVLEALIKKDKGIEINTSGYRYGINDTYPNIKILKRYKELGGKIITIGSDSHTSDGIAAHFEDAYKMLKAVGFEHITTFKHLTPNFIKI